MYDSLARFTAAYQLMEMYASAKLVATQRIHCALPCVAMGTPVIFINSPVMPGGGGTKTVSSLRTVGLVSYSRFICSFHGECQRLAKKLLLVQHPSKSEH